MNKNLVSTQGRKRLTLLCVLAIIAILFATLWPFNPFPPNRVSWLPGADGIAFRDPGLVVSKTPLQVDAPQTANAHTLELFVRPASVDSSSTILTFYVPGNPVQLRVRQWMNTLIVAHDVFDKHRRPIERGIGSRPFHQAELLLLTIVFTPGSTSFYVDGKLQQSYPSFVIRPQELSGQIIIGNSAVNYAPWAGQIRGMAIYSKELTAAEVAQHYREWIGRAALKSADLGGLVAYYAFSERTGRIIHNAVSSGPVLEIPESFAVVHKSMLKSVIQEFGPSWNYVNDVLRNIAGFVPVGFIFGASFLLTRSRPAAVFCATLAGGALSLVVEVLQFYIPQRSSGLTDVVTNTLGSALGAVIARPTLIRVILRRKKEEETFKAKDGGDANVSLRRNTSRAF